MVTLKDGSKLPAFLPTRDILPKDFFPRGIHFPWQFHPLNSRFNVAFPAFSDWKADFGKDRIDGIFPPRLFLGIDPPCLLGGVFSQLCSMRLQFSLVTPHPRPPTVVALCPLLFQSCPTSQGLPCCAHPLSKRCHPARCCCCQHMKSCVFPCLLSVFNTSEGTGMKDLGMSVAACRGICWNAWSLAGMNLCLYQHYPRTFGQHKNCTWKM